MQKRIRRASIILLLSLLPAGLLQATPATPDTRIVQQSGECRGVVKDTNGEPIIGASVVVKASTQGMITDLDGRFSIADVRPGAVLEISYIGYIKQTVTWNGQPLNVTLKEDTQQLDEVVVGQRIFPVGETVISRIKSSFAPWNLPNYFVPSFRMC